MNHACLSATSAQLGRIKALIVAQAAVLDSSSADLAPGTSLITKISGMRQAVIGGQKACMRHLQSIKTGLTFL